MHNTESYNEIELNYVNSWVEHKNKNKIKKRNTKRSEGNETHEAKFMQRNKHSNKHARIQTHTHREREITKWIFR